MFTLDCFIIRFMKEMIKTRIKGAKIAAKMIPILAGVERPLVAGGGGGAAAAAAAAVAAASSDCSFAIGDPFICMLAGGPRCPVESGPSPSDSW